MYSISVAERLTLSPNKNQPQFHTQQSSPAPHQLSNPSPIVSKPVPPEQPLPELSTAPPIVWAVELLHCSRWHRLERNTEELGCVDRFGDAGRGMRLLDGQLRARVLYRIAMALDGLISWLRCGWQWVASSNLAAMVDAYKMIEENRVFGVTFEYYLVSLTSAKVVWGRSRSILSAHQFHFIFILEIVRFISPFISQIICSVVVASYFTCLHTKKCGCITNAAASCKYGP